MYEMFIVIKKSLQNKKQISSFFKELEIVTILMDIWLNTNYIFKETKMF